MLDSRLTVSSRIHKFVIAFVLFQVASFLLLFALFLFPVLFFVCALVFWGFSLYLFSRRLSAIFFYFIECQGSSQGVPPEAGAPDLASVSADQLRQVLGSLHSLGGGNK